MKNTLLLFALLPASALLPGCETESPAVPMEEPTSFTLTIENTSQAFSILSSGAQAVPLGAEEAGPIFAGNAYEVSFYAGPGQRLHFASMFVQSNDLFYAPGEEGILLFDSEGMPRTGDITDALMLWDAGTEANEEPGIGLAQAPRQTEAGAGAPDVSELVRLAEDEWANLPAVEEVIAASLHYEEGNRFTLLLENVSVSDTLMTSDGGAHPTPLAPVIWAVSPESSVLFAEGEAATVVGLESLAEDGSPMQLLESLAPNTGLATPFAPAAVLVGGSLFDAGMAASPGLEALAEDGSPALLAEETGAMTVGDAPLLPGEIWTVSFDAWPGDVVDLASMLVQSNDHFVAVQAELFDGAMPNEGELAVVLWDAGTEVDQAPGAGTDQAPRQAGPNTGADEGAVVTEEVAEGAVDPNVLLRVTLAVN